MRVSKFRDVLWQTARKIGLDPDKDNFLVNEAIPLGESLSQWVRRTYPSRDWPEWTKTAVVNPDSNHIVAYDPVMYGPQGTLSAHIFRVFDIYLVDPGTTSAPVSLDYTLREEGIHVGFDHGQSVWVKYIEPPPRFTAEGWRPDTNYARDDVAYSYTTGHVYKSKVTGNLGHDPATTFSPPPPHTQPPIQLPTEITQILVPDNPGVAQKSQVVLLSLTTRDGASDIPNPPPNLSRVAAIVSDADGNTIGSGISFPNGTNTSDIILTDIANQLIADLGAGWTITTDTDALTIRIENLSGFAVIQWLYIPVGGPAFYLLQTQLQTYVPAILPSDGTRQVIEFPLTPDQVVLGARYTLTFKDLEGVDHAVGYTSQPSDQAEQILNGLIEAIQSGATNDLFLQDITAVLDTVGLADLFGTSTAISLDASMTLPGSPWWELVPFPTALADMVMRGGYADILKSWGQQDKGTAEEGQVPQEAQLAQGNYDSLQTNPLTNQQKPYSRYKIS